MALTEIEQARINYFRRSLTLQEPELETDAAYKFSDEDLLNILQIVTPTHNPKYEFSNLPDSQLHFVYMLGRKEIFYRLSTSTAPFYPLSAEGASLKKNVRFDHYFALVQQVEKDYADAVKLAKDNEFGEVTTFESVSQKDYYSRRAYNRAGSPTVDFTVSNITSTSINLDWTKYNVPNGLFANYSIYVEKVPLIDEYAEFVIRTNTGPKIVIPDIHRLKYRVDKLTPDTDYYVTVITRDRNGLFGYKELLVRTLPLS